MRALLVLALAGCATYDNVAACEAYAASLERCPIAEGTTWSEVITCDDASSACDLSPYYTCLTETTECGEQPGTLELFVSECAEHGCR